MIAVSQEDAKSLEKLVNSPELVDLIRKYIGDQNLGIEKTLKECWNYQSSLRAKAVCSTCSANSKRFFKDRKGNVREEVCDELIEKCALPLFKINRLVNSYQTLYINQDLLEKVGIIINAKEKLFNGFNKFFKNYKSPLLDGALETKLGKMFQRSLKKDRTKKDSYCEYMARLNLVNTPYIVKLAKKINSNVAWKMTTKTNMPLSSISSSASLMPRSLDLKDQSQNILGLGDDGGLETKDIRIMANNGHSNVQVSRIPGLRQISEVAMLSGMNFP